MEIFLCLSEFTVRMEFCDERVNFKFVLLERRGRVGKMAYISEILSNFEVTFNPRYNKLNSSQIFKKIIWHYPQTTPSVKLFQSPKTNPENYFFNSISYRLLKIIFAGIFLDFNHFTVCISLHTRTLGAHSNSKLSFVSLCSSFSSFIVRSIFQSNKTRRCGIWTIYFYAFKINLGEDRRQQ